MKGLYSFNRNLCTLVCFFLLFVSCSKNEDPIPIPPKPTPPNPKFESTIIIGAKEYTIDSVDILKLADGVKYTVCKLKNSDFPLVFYTVEIATDQINYSIQAWKGKDSLRGIERPSVIAKRKSDLSQEVIVAINGGFYSMSDRTPVGVQIVNGLMINSPRYTEPDPAIGFDSKGIPYIDEVKMNSKVSKENQDYNITKVNRPRLENDLVLYNSYFGIHTKTNAWGCELLLKPIEGQWESLSNYKKVRLQVENKTVSGSGGAMVIPKGKLVLSGHGKANDFLASIEVGEELVVDVGVLLGGAEVDCRNMISTHNIILKELIKAELKDVIAIQRHPRTAVGYTPDKSKVYFIVVDGRNINSKGVTTKELADIFLYWGASDAVNLDGGGSSCMVLNHKIVNRPSDSNERAVSDGLFVIKHK